jgi:hypothetical protein
LKSKHAALFGPLSAAGAIILSYLIFCQYVYADEDLAGQNAASEQPARVVVESMRNPQLKSYRAMSAGLDAFDKFRAYAPNATLRFRLSRRTDLFGEQKAWDGVTLRVAGKETSIPIPLAADGTFALPRNQAAYDEDADLVLNQKKETINFLAEVHTPGVPANARRLGDLRLQCRVLLAILKPDTNLAMRAFFNTVFLGSDWCASNRARIGVFLGDWPMSATAVYEGKRKPITSGGYGFLPPIQDKSLPDDALIEFEFWSKASAERKKEFLAQTPLFLKSSADKWRAGTPLQMRESGRYSAVMQLQPGSWLFRMESTGRALALGGDRRETPVALSSDIALKYHGGRLALKVEQAGKYEFSVNLQDPDHPVCTIKRVDA